MYNSLNQLRNLPNETTIFPGHDNGLKNLTMCKMFEPSNEFLNAKLKVAKEGNL
jgi:hypothetical protein